MSALVPRASSGSSRQATISEVLGGRRGGGDSAKGVAEGKYPTGSPEWKFPTGPTEGKQSAYMGVKRVAPSKSRGGEERERLLEENLVEGWREAHGGAKGVEERQLGSCFELTQNRERLVVESLVEGGREAHGGAKGVEERRFEAPHNILEGEREVHGGVEGVEERRLGGEGREHARLFNACVQNETGREVGEGEVRGCGDGGAELSGCEWEGGWDSESEWEECGEGMAGVMDGWRSGGGERQEREEKEEREEREKREEGEGREEKQEKEERKGEEREEREEEEEKQEREESEKREGREEREEREGRMKCIDVEKACAQVGRRRMEERRMEEREGEEEEVKEKEVTLALTQKAFQMPHMSFEDATHNQEGMEKQEMGSRVEKGGKAGRARKKRQLEKQQQQQLCIDSLLQHVAAGGTRGAGACGDDRLVRDTKASGRMRFSSVGTATSAAGGAAAAASETGRVSDGHCNQAGTSVCSIPAKGQQLQHQQEQPQQYMPGAGDISEQEEDMACEEKETSCEEKKTVREENDEKLRGDEQRACGGEGTQADDQHEVTWVAVRESGAMRPSQRIDGGGKGRGGGKGKGRGRGKGKPVSWMKRQVQRTGQQGSAVAAMGIQVP
ncbi:unnamed protein product [Closterium sp. NIES-54]